MRAAYRLVIIVTEAAFIATAASFALELIADNPLFTRDRSAGLQETAALAAVFIPIGAAAWWMFRKLRSHYPRREARAAAIAFGVFTPVSLLVALLVAQIPAGHAVVLLGNPSGRVGGLVGFLSAFVAIVMMTALLSFVPSALAFWVARRTRRVDVAEPLDEG